MYGRWLAEFTFEQIQRRALSNQRSAWVEDSGDRRWVGQGSFGDKLALNNPDWVNLVGQTTYDQLLGTLRGSEIGHWLPKRSIHLRACVAQADCAVSGTGTSIAASGSTLFHQVRLTAHSTQPT
jgi:hypothetical protein